MVERPIDENLIASHNARPRATLNDEYDALGRMLSRRGFEIEAITERVAEFGVAIPSWGLVTGGTRVARFPGPGEPRDIFDKLEDCAVVHQLSRATPSVSLHFPWDKVEDVAALKTRGESLGLGAVNSNTFQDKPGQAPSDKFVSLTDTDAAVRAEAVRQNVGCIEIGRRLSSKALTVWIGDGANFPGQQHLARASERYLDSTAQIDAALPADWRLFIEHKVYEPAFYATVIQDWGSSLMAAQTLEPKAFCLVDLGHHAPNVNIEMIVARLIHAGRLDGFHFNDSKYGDDDLDAGSIDPYRLFLVFNELLDAEWGSVPDFDPAHMLDQSHNVTDLIQSLIASAVELTRADALALVVDGEAPAKAQELNDGLVAMQILKRVFTADLSPILAMARLRSSGAINPIETYRASGDRDQKADERPAVTAAGGGIV